MTASHPGRSTGAAPVGPPTSAILRAAVLALLLGASVPALTQTTGAARSGSGAAEKPPEFAFGPLRSAVPPGWQADTPGSRFRVAQYRVPAAAGAGMAEAVVFYFGKDQGGPVAANIDRWTSQFSSADGHAVQPLVEVFEARGLPVTWVELNGSYARAVGGSPGGPARPQQTLLAAIVQTPQGNLTFQLHGDRATVAAHRAAFRRMVEGLRTE